MFVGHARLEDRLQHSDTAGLSKSPLRRPSVSGTLADELENYETTKADIAAGGAQQQTVFTALDQSPAFAYRAVRSSAPAIPLPPR
jgi:hypothetical protein